MIIFKTTCSFSMNLGRKQQTSEKGTRIISKVLVATKEIVHRFFRKR